MERNDCSRASVWSRNRGGLTNLDGDVLIVVPSVNLKGLVMAGLVMDVNGMHLAWFAVGMMIMWY